MTHTVIHCKLHRKGGTKINLYGKDYHFKPEDPKADADDKEVAHVCAIPNTEAKAIYRLLAIKDAYVLVDADAELPAKPKDEPGQTVAGAQAEAKKDVIIQGADGEEINLSQMEPAELRAFAKEQFEIRVHSKWSNETVIAKIIEAMRGSDE